MNKFKFPVIVPKGCDLVLMQPYGNTSLNEWYKEHGIDAPFHNGVDVAIRPDPDGRLTYGTACIAPSNAKKVKTTWEDAMSTKGNGVTLQLDPFMENGKMVTLQVVFWHLSEIVDERNFKAGDVIGYIGNSGLVSPKPTPERPYDGSHLHFMLFEFHDGILQNANNGVGGAIDPLTRFDLNDVVYGNDTDISKDLPPIKWAFILRGLTEPYQKIIFALRNWWNSN